MKKSIYELLTERDELESTTCDWCCRKYQDLYVYNGDNVCRDCLESEYLEESEL